MKKITKCNLCELCMNTAPVNGYGNPNADVMFIIDNPNYHDIRNGYVLSEGTGELFNKLLTMINLTREEVYTTTLIKGRPYGGSIKTKNITACKPYLKEEIEAVNPKLIITLGSKTLHTLTKSKLPIAAFANKGLITTDKRMIIATYNLAYILRDVRNHGLALRDFVNIYKAYVKFINPSLRHHEDNLHDAVKTILEI